MDQQTEKTALQTVGLGHEDRLWFSKSFALAGQNKAGGGRQT